MTRLQFLKKNRKELLKLAESFGAKNVRIFGSVIRLQDNEDSDIDFLVTFQKGTSLFDRGGLITELKEFTGCDVDVVSDSTIKPALRDEILSTAEEL